MARPRSVTETKPHACEVPGCGRRFGSVQGLGRHMVETHGAKMKSPRSRSQRATPRASANGEPSRLVAAIHFDIDRMADPLRARLVEFDHEIASALATVAELREARRVIVHALKPFEPKSEDDRRGNTFARHIAEQDRLKLEGTRAFILDTSTLTTFTRESLYQDMKAAGIDPLPSSKKLAPIIEQLRDEGLVRAGAVAKGGGLQYIVIREGGTNGRA